MLLCAGVGEMLSRGRHTCAALKSAIDGALVTLLGKMINSSPLLCASYNLMAFTVEIILIDFSMNFVNVPHDI